MDNLNAVLDYITKHMLDTVKGDASAKLGGVLAIVALINALDLVDVCKTDTRISRFGNFLSEFRKELHLSSPVAFAFKGSSSLT